MGSETEISGQSATSVAEIDATGRALKGVFHLAMTIDDAPITTLTQERMRHVLAPRAYGAWLLHEGTQGMDLDNFVMFSSVFSIFGNPLKGTTPPPKRSSTP